MDSAEEPKSAAQIGNIEAVKFTTKFDNLIPALTILEKHDVKLSHVESRQSKEFKDCHDFMVVPTTQMNGLQTAIDELRKIGKCVTIIGADIWIPKHVSDLDRYVDKVLSAGEDLEADHPGFTDAVYRERRKYFADIAKNYKHGESIPRVEYREDEVKTWNAIYTRLTALYPKHACKEFLEAFPLLQQKCGYSADNIPQLEDISNFLRDRSGFSLRPVAGLLSSRDFLAGLAFRVFHATQYIRHGSKPLYTPEPDVCHELLGHVPMFADPDFAQFSQELGLASLGASEEDVKKLATLYWFTIEFGLCREGKDVKAYGAGILSSFGEIEYCQTDEPERRNFEPEKAAIQEYPITRFQPIYYVADSFKSAKDKMKDYASKIPRSFNVRYNPFTKRIDVIDGTKGVVTLVKELQGEVNMLQDTLTKIGSFRQ
ncbi:phenylalanine-4-hydroxylase [Mytilus galloprovincialis]|uniref:phenylalanine 4-monooxygenase n=1 Tax=Mytilus galloprovincialis TaxID=29158 RepID=A0A8B6G0F4_MYTGA|nr:phenylalanine-4-hydroxylase [Mytilus galloprovincialis]